MTVASTPRKKYDLAKNRLRYQTLNYQTKKISLSIEKKFINWFTCSSANLSARRIILDVDFIPNILC